MNVFGVILSPSDLWLFGIVIVLVGILAKSIIGRTNDIFTAKRKAHTENVTKCIAPFKDAIANIHLGEHNTIAIMNSFFRSQEEAIAIFKSQCEGKDFTGLQKAWNAYSEHYEHNAKGMVHSLFAVIPEPNRTDELNYLHKLLSNIINEIKKT